jgi:hypothetical protein
MRDDSSRLDSATWIKADGSVLVHSYADSQNAYAALLQATSACTVAPNGDNRPLVNLGFSNEGLGAGESVIDLKVGKER